MSIGAGLRRLSAILDAAAIAVFVTIGLVAHRRGLDLGGYARDLVPIAGCWFAAAAIFHPYRDPGTWRLVATWACGVTAGVLVRALLLGRSLDGGEAAFLVVSLTTIGALVVSLRAGLALARRSPIRGLRPAGRARAARTAAD